MARAALAFLIVAATLFAQAAYAAERRVALVFGANAYRDIRPLDNAVNDALAIEKALTEIGFEVRLETNRDLALMRGALDDFREMAKDADVALVYFAGHGVEIDGRNRLLPVNADASSAEALELTSLPLEDVTAALSRPGRIGLVVLDACRNDPFGQASAEGRGAATLTAKRRTVTPGLGRMGRSENMLFAFSAAPGETAADGTDGNSPFTAALSRHLGTDGLEFRSVLTLVQQDVYDRSGGSQLPYVESGLPQFFFAGEQGELAERDRLLLAMADLDADAREDVEAVAASNDVPLAPLYATLLGADDASLPRQERLDRLEQAADGFVRVRDEIRTLSAFDPQVAELRADAQQDLALGAFGSAREKLAEAVELDRNSRLVIKANFSGRTRSEAETHFVAGGAARLALDYGAAIASYENALAVFDELDSTELTADDRHRQVLSFEALGKLYQSTGDSQSAEYAFTAMAALAEAMAFAEPANSVWPEAQVVGGTLLADVRLARGEADGALAALDAARGASEQLAALEPETLKWRRDEASILNRIGDIAYRRGELDTAGEHYRAAHAIMEAVASAEPTNAQWRSDLSLSWSKIGNVHEAAGELQDAFDAYQEALRIRQALVKADPDNLRLLRDLSVSQNSLGDVLITGGFLKEAANAYQHGLRTAARIVEADPLNPQARRDLSFSHIKVGDAALQMGDHETAEASYRAAVAIREELSDIDAANRTWLHELGTAWSRLGDVLAAADDLGGAVDAFDRSLALLDMLARDMADAAWLQRERIILNVKLSDLGQSPASHLETALGIATALQADGRLPAGDQWMVPELQKRLEAVRGG